MQQTLVMELEGRKSKIKACIDLVSSRLSSDCFLVCRGPSSWYELVWSRRRGQKHFNVSFTNAVYKCSTFPFPDLITPKGSISASPLGTVNVETKTISVYHVIY